MKVADHRDQDQLESTRNPESQDACAFAIAVARIASVNKTEDLCVLDLRGLSNLADYFVIGTGTSGRQMHAVLEEIEEYARTVGRRPFGLGDSRDSAWLLADYVDVVIHLFDPEHRSYYDLDGLWGDAPQVAWQPVESAPV
jgi:ribosome-associated protein